MFLLAKAGASGVADGTPEIAHVHCSVDVDALLTY